MVLYLLRFGELWLKSEQVRKRFIDLLARQLKRRLTVEEIKGSISKERGRLFLETDKDATSILSHLFGLTSFSVVSKGPLAEAESLVRDAAKQLKNGDTFAIRARRIGDHTFSSKDMEIKLGAMVVKEHGNKVDLSNPTKTIYVEIREDECYVFSDYEQGLGGLPLGVEGEVLAEFDGSKEAVVATFLIMRRGCKATLVGRGDTTTLKAYDPTIELVAEVPLKHAAKALVSPESIGDATETHKHGLFVLRPLVGMTKKEIDERYTRL